MYNSHSATTTGRIGEFFVMYLLEKHGIQCHHVTRFGVDLWCQSHLGDVFTVEVKSSNKNKRGRYAYDIKDERIADFYVFVALELETIIVRAAEELPTAVGHQLAPHQFNTQELISGIQRLGKFKRGRRKTPKKK
jgi:hypothetical protein